MEILNLLFTTGLRRARHYSRKLWVRVVLMGLLAVVATGMGQLAELVIPDKLAQTVDGSAADRLLQLIASAMLAVTIFSITVMVSVYQSSSTQWTPRVHQLIMTDKTTQNTMAVFIGAYVYALLGIILRELGVYVDDRAFVLFWMTVMVLVVIVVYLIRWVLHLQGFGQLLDTTRQVEGVTRAKLANRMELPCLGARPLVSAIPEETRCVPAWDSGFLQQVYPEALNKIGQEYDVQLYLTLGVGALVFGGTSVVEVCGAADDIDWEAFCTALEDAIVIDDVRDYEQDPRFGLIVMGEIGSKALSPGINDAGTAVDVITRVGRILARFRDETAGVADGVLEHVYIAPLDPVDLLDDGLGALSRNGAGVLEVQQCLQRTLGGLMGHEDASLRAAAKDMATRELDRALGVIAFAPDRDALIASAHRDVRPK